MPTATTAAPAATRTIKVETIRSFHVDRLDTLTYEVPASVSEDEFEQLVVSLEGNDVVCEAGSVYGNGVKCVYRLEGDSDYGIEELHIKRIKEFKAD